MRTLLKIAWRNVWRNPRRSWVLISAIAIGVFCFMGVMAYMGALTSSMVNASIELQGGHLQIAAPGYFDNPAIHNTIQEPAAFEKKLDQIQGIAYAPTVGYAGMANSAEQASGVLIQGIDVQRYPHILPLESKIQEGVYFDGAVDNPVLIGAALAKQLNVLLGEKIVLMTNDVDNEIAAGAFRVAGIFKSSSSEFDKTTVFLPLDEARAMVGYTDDQTTAYSIRLLPGFNLEPVQQTLQTSFAGTSAEVLTWRDRESISGDDVRSQRLRGIYHRRSTIYGGHLHYRELVSHGHLRTDT